MTKALKFILLLHFIVKVTHNLGAQISLDSFGYTHLAVPYQNNDVDLLIKSKKGEAHLKKPLLILIQGSGHKPLFVYNDDGSYFPPIFFDAAIFEKDFHIIMINKPGMPLIVNSKQLNKKRQYVDPDTNRLPKRYVENNFLEYYTHRNKVVVDYLSKQSWVDSSMIVVAGHSEGSSIAAYMAFKSSKITHLIYSGGNPYYSRILAMVVQDRNKETEENELADEVFQYWKRVIKDTTNLERENGWNSNKGTFSFSKKENEILKELSIPVLISYGTKDPTSPFNDMLKIESLLEQKKHITFHDYIGREHNYFKIDTNGQLIESTYAWDQVGKNWLKWIKSTQAKNLK